MSGLFSKPKVPKPVVTPPPAIPQSGTEAEDFAGQSIAKRSGFKKTILTGSLAPPSRGKKQLLG